MSARARHARILGVVAAVLLVAGAAAIMLALRAQQHAPQPPPEAASPVSVRPRPPSPIPTASGATDALGSSPMPTGTPHGPSASASPTTQGPLLPRARPTHLSIPAIGVDSNLKSIGLTPSGMIQTPPLVRDSHAYWLTVSPTPGQLGPATIIGHVDSAAYGPGVFFRLGALRQREMISVTRADGVVAVFQIERVVEYPKAHFPTQAVYGNTDNAALRLITCGGIFDPSIGSYENNIVVYAALVSTHKA